MQCDICFRTGGHKLPFLCPTDARNQLYEARVKTAGILLEKDALDRQLSALFPSTSGTPGQHSQPTTALARSNVSEIHAERERVIERTNQIIAHADELRAKVEEAKRERDRKKAAIERRRSELAAVSSGAEVRRAKQIQEVESSTLRTKYRWNQAYSLIGGSRTYLCYEAAKLYGLQRVKRITGGEDYKIGGINIVDLRSMNSASAAQISTSLSHVTHVLMLATHYLAIRLPAEIILPHRDYPLPTIFALSSSYTHADVPFPASILNSSSSSPSASRHAEHSNQPRPRPLWISKPLPILAHEDPAVYAHFIEGVVLLAYNIAWLCKSQGIPVGPAGESSSFEDVCNIGKNLWKLLIGDKPRLQPTPRPVSLQTGTTKRLDRDGNLEEGEEPKSDRPILGWASHGSAYSFLGSAEGTEFIRGFKLPRPTHLADRLKSRLTSEIANAEWEMLDQDSWAIEEEVVDDGVVVGARREANAMGAKNNRDHNAGVQSFMSMRTVMDAVEMVGGDGLGISPRFDGKSEGQEQPRDRKPGTSGWTKLKPRV
ncbi:hypothetical protein ACMFMG_011438 [Clarireedia jacksonii]